MRNAYGYKSVDDIPTKPGLERWTKNSEDTKFCIADAMEKVAEWNYDDDAHGYCHDRPTLIGLLREIERLRAQA